MSNATLQDLLKNGHAPIRILDGIPSFVHEIPEKELRWNKIYNHIAPFYDYSERYLGRLLVGVDFRSEWERIVNYAHFKKGDSILEVSPGSGVYQPYLWNSIGSEGNLVALDLSIGMLRMCEKRKQKDHTATLLVHGNGSDLPFKDSSFDGTFHVGGINLYAEPEKSLSEIARVTKPGGTIIIGDEGFANNTQRTLRHKILERLNPGFLKGGPPKLPPSMVQKSVQWFMNGCLYVIIAEKR